MSRTITSTTPYRHTDTTVEAIRWVCPDAAWDVIEALEEHDVTAFYDGQTAGNPGPGGEDWGSLTIDTRHGSIEVAPLDYLVIHTEVGLRARVSLLTQSEMRATYARI